MITRALDSVPNWHHTIENQSACYGEINGKSETRCVKKYDSKSQAVLKYISHITYHSSQEHRSCCGLIGQTRHRILPT